MDVCCIAQGPGPAAAARRPDVLVGAGERIARPSASVVGHPALELYSGHSSHPVARACVFTSPLSVVWHWFFTVSWSSLWPGLAVACHSGRTCTAIRNTPPGSVPLYSAVECTCGGSRGSAAHNVESLVRRLPRRACGQGAACVCKPRVAASLRACSTWTGSRTGRRRGGDVDFAQVTGGAASVCTNAQLSPCATGGTTALHPAGGRCRG